AWMHPQNGTRRATAKLIVNITFAIVNQPNGMYLRWFIAKAIDSHDVRNCPRQRLLASRSVACVAGASAGRNPYQIIRCARRPHAVGAASPRPAQR
ncbi:MAG: hypothetical protein Q8J99_14220, partial [Sulfuritalea sp.]|nr:hypothetical protein [Sulfuritalea sp.]